MDEQGNTTTVESAANSGRTAGSGKGQDRESRTKRLEKYRWRPGQSGNPTGRPKKLPVSEMMVEVMDLPLPKRLRGILQDAIDAELPKNMTFSMGVAFGLACSLFCPELNNFRVDVVHELRIATEGREHFRIFTPSELAEAVIDAPTDLRDRVMLGIVKMMKERKELYGLELPKFAEMESKVIEDIRKTG